MKALDIRLELKGLIDKETDVNLLETVKELLTHKNLDPSIEKEMTTRVLLSERDIKEGKVYEIDQAEKMLNMKLGL